MELDRRSCHFIVTVPKDCRPSPADIPILKADVVIAKWSIKNKSLSVWYSWTNAQRPSTVTNGWNVEDIVLKHTKLDKRTSFMEMEHDWTFAPQLTSTNEKVAVATDKDQGQDSDDESIEFMSKTIKRKREIVAQLAAVKDLHSELQDIVDSIKRFKNK